MHKKIYEIELTTDDADPVVYMNQRLPFQDRSQRIQIHADQIDELVQWLEEAKGLISSRGEIG